MFRKTSLMGAHNVIDVPVLEDYTALIKKNGGTIVVPRIRVPGIGRIAVFRDPEGNEFGLLEAEPPEENES
jgi:predicted enzyme related to lactoylglutathione lyase